MHQGSKAVSAAILLSAILATPVLAADALSGTVTSPKEGAMEGVVVSATKDGEPVTIIVATDEKGVYRFPDSKLSPGHYTIELRAIGYDLDGADKLDVKEGGTKANLKLKPTKDLTKQLVSSEWMWSADMAENSKKQIYSCNSCHSLERVFRSSHTADDFTSNVFQRMANYTNQTFPLSPQMRQYDRGATMTLGEDPVNSPLYKFAVDIAKSNLSAQESWKFPFKTLPRPKGRATRVIMTEYHLPRKVMQPHDVIVDAKGIVWFSNFGENQLGKFDPKTLKFTAFPYDTIRPGFPNGNLDLETDEEGNLWLALMTQTGAAKFDPKTEKYRIYPVPQKMWTNTTQQSMVAPNHIGVDNKFWVQEAEKRAIGRFDAKTGDLEPWIDPFAKLPKGEAHSLYGIFPDSKNNLYFADYSNGNIGKIDAKTLATTLYPTPTPNSRPRRGHMDAQDRVWFAEWRADKVAMMDTRTGEIKEWALPGQYIGPYDAVADKNGWIWTGNMHDDRVTRVNSKTGETIAYLFPHEMNMRRVFVDDSGAKPVFWSGSNHSASIFKVETLD